MLALGPPPVDESEERDSLIGGSLSAFHRLPEDH